MRDFTFHPLTPEGWEDFVAPFSEHGVQNGCWCTYWRLTQQQFHGEYYEVLPWLSRVMLADSDAWNLYNQPIRERYRQMTVDYIERVWHTAKNWEVNH